VADVPLATSLSGDLDSALIAALAVRDGMAKPAFHLAFSSEAWDETRLALGGYILRAWATAPRWRTRSRAACRSLTPGWRRWREQHVHRRVQRHPLRLRQPPPTLGRRPHRSQPQPRHAV